MKRKQAARAVCYCGKSGDCNLNMLQCSKCKHWMHEGCTKCLSAPMLFGDHFFIFVCSGCNAGSECLARMEMQWVELLHLILYHLSIKYKTKYFDLDKHVLPFIAENWDSLYLIGPIASQKKDEKRSKILQVLHSSKDRFKSGKEVKKKKTLWSLRKRLPPEAPPVVPVAARIDRDVVVWDFNVKERKYELLTRKRSSDRKEIKNGKSRGKAPTLPPSRPKKIEVSKCRGSVPDSENNHQKLTKQKSKQPSSTSQNDDSACYGLLDSLIPFPPDFKQQNNPFFKLPSSGTKRKHNHEAQKTHIRPNKRQRNGEPRYNHATENGNSYKFYNDIKLSCTKNISDSKSNMSLMNAKEYLSHNLWTNEDDSFCIIGKRFTPSGKIQYLFEWSRESVLERHRMLTQRACFQIAMKTDSDGSTNTFQNGVNSV